MPDRSALPSPAALDRAVTYLATTREQEQDEAVGPLSQDELRVLGTYNAERSRGVAHDAEYRVQMARLQARFDLAGYEVPRRRWWLR